MYLTEREERIIEAFDALRLTLCKLDVTFQEATIAFKIYDDEISSLSDPIELCNNSNKVPDCDPKDCPPNFNPIA